MPSCASKPTSQEEYEACLNIPAEDVTSQMLKTAHRWVMMDADEHAKKNDFLSAYKLSRTNAIFTKHATAYCTDPAKRGERVNDIIDSESKMRCSMFDMDGSAMKEYCGAHDKHRINSRKTIEPTCTQASLGDAVYKQLGVEYCKKNPKELWCSCYNLQTKLCDTDKAAAGCSMAKLDPNLASDAAIGQEGFDTLLSMQECRFGVCEGDVMKERPVACPSTMKICGKDWPTASTRTSQIIRHCVVDAGGDEDDLEQFGVVPDNTDDILKALKPKENTEKIKEKESRVATVGMLVSSSVSCLMILAAFSLR